MAETKAIIYIDSSYKVEAAKEAIIKDRAREALGVNIEDYNDTDDFVSVVTKLKKNASV
jgi:hypothetical protein